MSNLARSSKFNIHIDFEKSHGSYLFDKRTNRYYLDFFGMYASLPLGYNHPVFHTKEFQEEYLRTSFFKINNCEFVSDETLEFDRVFTRYAGKGVFKHFHYSCTGALAVEAAIKTSIQHKGCQKPNILSFENSFHGINSYGGFVTSRFSGADRRLNGFPEVFSTKINCDIEEVKLQLTKGDITCVLVEPIQCSAGDIHHDREFFTELRELCTSHDVPLIFDEIQIGFGGTGKLWYFEHLGVEPDIVIFGKKTQLSGIMVKEEFGSIFANGQGIRLEVTWDGDVSDMVRCKYIIKTYEEEKILENVKKQASAIKTALESEASVQNFRNCGLIIGLDLKNTQIRDIMVNNLFNRGLLCNATGKQSIRLRPSLSLSTKETDTAIEMFQESLEGL